MSYIPAALASLQSSTALLSTLHFHSTNALSAALLAPEAAFETHLIRDAAPHELALFEPASSVQPVLLDSADLSRAGDGERWTATKRAQPKQVGGWEKASPLKQKKGAAGQQEDPLRCLKAAERLLQVYPMPRAQEHVQGLQDMYQGLIDTLQTLEEQLKKPIPRSTLALNPHAEAHARAAELEELIKREQMEIFALEQLSAEKRAEAQAAVKAKAKPAPRKPLNKPAPSPAEANPFAKSSLLESKRTAVSRPSPPPSASSPSPRRAPPSKPSTPQRTATPSSPMASPVRAGAAGARKSVGGSTSAGTTPKRATSTAPRRSVGAGGGGGATPVAAAAGGKKKVAANAVGKEDLEAISAKIWSTPALGDALRPWGRKTLLTLEQDPTAIDSPDFDLTLATLSAILASPPADPTPPSPGSILTSTTADGEGGDPTPLSATMMLEYEALWLLLSTLSGSPPSPLPSSSAPSPASTATPQALTWFLRAPSTLLPSSLVAPLSPSSIPTGPPRPVPHVPFAALKTVLARYAGEKGWDESQATTAIYSLVSKKVVMIERRGVGGAGVRFL